MSRYNKYMSLAGVNFQGLGLEELKKLSAQLLEDKIHGLCFSPYIDQQGPGTVVTEEQILNRLEIIEPTINWIRTFSCTEGNQLIPEIAARKGIKSLVGIWLDDDLENNELEMINAIDIGEAGHADMIAVGNEVLLRGDLTEQQLIDYIERIKLALPNVPVGYVDAYFKFEDYPKVTQACDVILANCYPFWEGCPADYSLLYMKDMYRRATRVANGKPVIITETGWPNEGSNERGAMPSYENALKYFINTYLWAEQEKVEVFYFSGFDEGWKVADEGDVGAYWGLWDKDGNFKYA
jgi:exo-beta-1,3-glucanase (GH17 family)